MLRTGGSEKEKKEKKEKKGIISLHGLTKSSFKIMIQLILFLSLEDKPGGKEKFTREKTVDLSTVNVCRLQKAFRCWSLIIFCQSRTMLSVVVRRPL